MDDIGSDRLGAAGRVLEPQEQEPRDPPGGRRRPPPVRKPAETEDDLEAPTHQVNRLA